VDSSIAFTRIVIYTTRMETLSAQEQGSMSKNNLRGIALVIKPTWGLNTLGLHLLLQSISRFIAQCRIAAGHQLNENVLFRHREKKGMKLPRDPITNLSLT